jgi:hypothetical protein
MDKVLFGWLFIVIYLGLLIAPVLIFSDYGYFITVNPIHLAEIDISFVVNRTLNESENIGSVDEFNKEMGVLHDYEVFGLNETE